MIFLCRFQTRLPFVVYADFECLTRPTGNVKGDHGHNSFEYQNHIPCTVGYKLVSLIPELADIYHAKHGINCVEWFLEQMLDLEKKCMAVLFDDKRMVMHSWDNDNFLHSTNCHICGLPFVWNADHTSQDKVLELFSHLLFCFGNLTKTS